MANPESGSHRKIKEENPFSHLYFSTIWAQVQPHYINISITIAKTKYARCLSIQVETVILGDIEAFLLPHSQWLPIPPSSIVVQFIVRFWASP